MESRHTPQLRRCAAMLTIAWIAAASACKPESAADPTDPLYAAATAARQRLATDPSPEAPGAVLASLRAAADAGGVAHPSRAAALADLDAALATRFDATTASLRAAWDAGDQTNSGLPTLEATALHVTQELGVDRLRHRVELQRGIELPAVAPDDTALAQLPRSSAALAAAEALREARGAPAIAADPAVLAAVDCARAFAAPDAGSWAGPQLASALASAPWPAGSPSSAAAPGTRLAEDLARGLRRRAIDALRARYEADARAALESGAPVLLAALRAARDRRVADIAATDVAALQAQVRALLDRDGALDRLRATYGGDAWLRSGPDEPPCDACELDLFLVDLQRIVSGGGRTAEEGEIEVTLVSGEQGPESLWTQREGAYMTLVLLDRKVQRPSIDWRSHSVSYTWTFQDARGKHLNAWWSPSAQSERDKQAPYLKFPGTLAPLLFAWLGGREDDAWRVTVRPLRTERDAEFVLRFGRPIPELPRALP